MSDMLKNKSLSLTPSYTRAAPSRSAPPVSPPFSFTKQKEARGERGRAEQGASTPGSPFPSPSGEGAPCRCSAAAWGTSTASGVSKTENLTLYSADWRSPHPSISLAPHPAGASRPAALGAVPPALPGGWRPFLTSSDLCSPEEGGEGDEHGHRRVPGPPFRFPSRGPSLHLHPRRPQA